MRENNITYDQIAGVEVGVNKWDAGLLRYPEPTTGSETKFSLNHSLAAAILLGKTDWQAWSDEAAVDPRFKEARTKVNVVNHPEWPADRAQSRVPVELTLKDGRKFTREYDEPINPTHEQVVERYRQCIGDLLPRDAVERSIDLLLNLEKMDDISPLMDLVRGVERG
ncbi:MAG: MmgE/PrpD family protein [Chloroflexi bacterium]|nr:MmgE/PrpD family protein [Chloroflexota bacterium]